jgi:hypothetical protein
VLIIAVIVIDVFVLFRKQIFGEKDDSSSKKAAVVIDIGEDAPSPYFTE